MPHSKPSVSTRANRVAGDYVRIELDTEQQILMFDGVKISLELLKCITAEDKLWFRVQRNENDVIVATKPIEQPEVEAIT